MTTEEFWDKYLNEDLSDIFDITYDFFSKELPKEFIDDYDVEEVILETTEHQETEKNFENVIKFTELIQRKHPEIYKDIFFYIDDILIDYYCFHNDHDKAESSFSNFVTYPISDYDKYSVSFKKLLFYGYTDILNSAITKNYKEVTTSDEVLDTAGKELATSKFFIELEKSYMSDNLDLKTFSSKIKKYDFEISDKFLSALETGLQKQLSKEEITNNFLNDRKNFMLTIEMFFLRYMLKRNIPFVISGRIWENILIFWDHNANKKRCSPDNYFHLKVNEFEEYLSDLSSSMFTDNRSEMIAVLWGSVYIYDFLKEIEIINTDTYKNFIEATRVLKGKVIGQHTADLWRSNFVHKWKKPDSISSIEFVEEEKIFKKSIGLKHQKFSRLRSQISDELKNIGELSTYIIEGGKIEAYNNDTSLLDKLFDMTNKNNNSDEEAIVNEPIKVEKKVGRNDPCPCGSGKKYKKCCGK